MYLLFFLHYWSYWCLTKEQLSEFPMSCSRKVTVTSPQTHTADRTWNSVKVRGTKKSEQHWQREWRMRLLNLGSLVLCGSRLFSLFSLSVSLEYWPKEASFSIGRREKRITHCCASSRKESSLHTPAFQLAAEI